MKSAIAWGACLLVFFACGTTLAQTATVSQEYDKLIKSRTNIEALGTDLFGDRIDTYTGALEFVQTDVSIPGNNALDVSIGRRFVLPRERSDLAPGMFGDWDLEIPHIHGVFSRDEGWTVNSTTPMNRCSKYAAPLDIVTADRYGIFPPSEYWHGTFLYMPGAGDQEVLKYQSGPRPATGTYPLTTKSLPICDQSGGYTKMVGHSCAILMETLTFQFGLPNPTLHSVQRPNGLAISPEKLI